MGWAKGLVAALVLIAAGLLPASAQQAPRRVALVIGNAIYANAGRLANPPNDARLVASALARAGFQIVDGKNDLGLQAFGRALRDFRAKANGAQVALVYYAGHGIEGGGKNWLIPTDATLGSEYDLTFEAVSLDQVMDALAGADLRVVILDACRDNPLGRSWTRGSRAVARGLAPVEADDVLVIFAAAPGMTAADGQGTENSPFATALAARLPEPGLAIQLLGGRVRDDVLRATGSAQRPFVSASITGQPFYLVSGPASSVPPPVDLVAIELATWQGALNGNSIAAYEDYLRQYPTGRFAQIASANIAGLRAPAVPAGRAIDRMVGRWELASSSDVNGVFSQCGDWWFFERIEGNRITYRNSGTGMASAHREVAIIADNEFQINRLVTSNYRLDGDTLTIWYSSGQTCRYARRPAG